MEDADVHSRAVREAADELSFSDRISRVVHCYLA
jgi:hypothetical protein